MKKEKTHSTSGSRSMVYPLFLFSLAYPFFLFVLLLFIGAACQEESEDITPPPADQTILPNSPVAQYIQQITLNDGSADNIIDHASCISVVLPVTVIVNNEEISIDAADDFKTVEKILDAFEEDDDTLQIVFPITVILADHDERVIRSSDELKDITDDCTEGGFDDDIECIDFQYPLTLTVYDSQNQLPGAVTVNNDEDLFHFLNDLKDTDFASFRFPITVILGDGQQFQVTTNDQLEDLIEETLEQCDEDDDSDHNDDDADDTEFITILTNGQWHIAQYKGESDETSLFSGFLFTFNEDGTATASDGITNVNGTWQTNGDDGSLELDLEYGEETPFEKLGEDWDLLQLSSEEIILQYEGDEGEAVTTLVFQKNQ